MPGPVLLPRILMASVAPKSSSYKDTSTDQTSALNDTTTVSWTAVDLTTSRHFIPLANQAASQPGDDGSQPIDVGGWLLDLDQDLIAASALSNEEIVFSAGSWQSILRVRRSGQLGEQDNTIKFWIHIWIWTPTQKTFVGSLTAAGLSITTSFSNYTASATLPSFVVPAGGAVLVTISCSGWNNSLNTPASPVGVFNMRIRCGTTSSRISIAPNFKVVYRRSPSDTSVLSDDASRTVSSSRANDDLALSDDDLRRLLSVGRVSDNALPETQEEIRRQLISNRAGDDELTLEEQLVRTASYSRELQNDAVADDLVQRNYQGNRTTEDNLSDGSVIVTNRPFYVFDD